MDRRGSLFLPTDFKRAGGFEPGSIFYLRAIGDTLVLIPIEKFIEKNVLSGTDHQKDAILVAGLNDDFGVKAKITTFPIIDMKSKAPDLPPLSLEELLEVKEEPSAVATVNKKGFIPIPESIKTLLGISVEDGIHMQVFADEDRKPVLVMKPVFDKNTLAQELQKRQQHETNRANYINQQENLIAHQKQQLALLRGQVEKEKERLAELENAIRVKERPFMPTYVMRLPEEADGIALTTSEKPELKLGHYWIDTRWGKAQIPIGSTLPDDFLPGAELKQPEEEPPLKKGHKWTNSPFGRIQVPDIDG